MTALNDFWNKFGRSAQLGLMLGAALIIIATIALGTWALRTHYQVLFAHLAPQDAATMVSELEKIKTPYRLSDEGTTIMVPSDVVYQTRLKLVGKELPLQGAVGFELFNDSEVGMTEFAQKVNYQRALQGELTRTILSLEEVQTARVHLVLSEQALFKKNGTQPKASITIAAKQGKTLDANQIQGIQRLVAAAVPDIKSNDVTIVNQHGVALTRRNSTEGEAIMSADGLDDKRAIEVYLNKKVVEVLDRTFGVGQGIASVDVTLNHDHVKVTTETVLGNGEDQGVATGAILRERHTNRATNNGTDAASTTPSAAPGHAGTASREVDYQLGRRVEQVVSAAGAVSHVNVAVVVRKALDQAQLERLKDIVARAVGADKDRGDAVAVYSVDQINSVPMTSTIVRSNPIGADATDVTDTAVAPAVAAEHITANGIASPMVLLSGVLVLILLAWGVHTIGRRAKEPRQLSNQERDRLLAQVHSWLGTAEQISRQPLQPTENS
ncbi:MAG: flagellar basal-body MS-ring/collar protein FliF [Pseudomonadota bacterium]